MENKPGPVTKDRTINELVTELVDESVNNLIMPEKREVLNSILNVPPYKGWLKEHPIAKNVLYLPVDKVELLLRKLFKRHRIEVIEYKQLFNSVSCQVRIHYIDPISGEWDFHDGVGAVGVQLDAGSQGSDMSKIKHDAVMKALPAAKSYAKKDAAEELGKIFGSDLNRKDTIAFTPDQKLLEGIKPNKDKLKND